MIDYHVHIGQFEESYYGAGEVFDAVFSNGAVDGLTFSSTSSCVKGAAYSRVEKEIEAALKLCPPGKTQPLFWFVPDYTARGPDIETAMGALPYAGFKLHPYAHNWDFADTARREALHAIFDYASGHALPVLIHTGYSGLDGADRFRPFFSEYPGAVCILAHGRPPGRAVAMLREFPNVYCDTAFMPKEDFGLICGAGFAGRMFPGSDFPITHYFRNKYPREGETGRLSLGEQYARDVRQMAEYQGVIEKNGEKR
jgi:hypothetical protein